MMSDRPEDLPQWVWDDAYGQAILYVQWLVPGPSEYVQAEYVLAQTIARAILKAREDAFEGLEAALIAKKYLPSQGMDAEMEAFNDGLDEALDAIRQHSQKGER